MAGPGVPGAARDGTPADPWPTRKSPITLTPNEKGEVVGMDNEAYAILDTMRYIRPKIHTVAVGKCHGNASLVLAAGDKGCRHSLPHVQISTTPPKLNRTFDSTQNVQIRANECAMYEDTYMGFMSEFSGKDMEEVREDLDRTRYFTPNQAIATQNKSSLTILAPPRSQSKS